MGDCVQTTLGESNHNYIVHVSTKDVIQNLYTCMVYHISMVCELLSEGCLGITVPGVIYIDPR